MGEIITIAGKSAEITGDPTAVDFLKKLHEAGLNPPEPKKSFPQTVLDYDREYNAIMVDNYNLRLRNQSLERVVASLGASLEEALK